MTREEAISEIKNMAKYNYTLAPTEVFDMAIKALEQEPKIGHWKHNKCDVCGASRPPLFDNFCPNCGARMIEPQERGE